MRLFFSNALPAIGLSLLIPSLLSPSFALQVPSIRVSECGSTRHVAKVSWDKPLPGQPQTTSFPLTQAEICYTDTSLQFTMTAFNETSFFYNATQTTNGLVFLYEVLEIFLSLGDNDPITYFELDISPNNVALQTFVFNPSGSRAPGTPFDHFIVTQPIEDGITAVTELDRPGHVWRNQVRIPLGFFNVRPGKAKGTRWRMNLGRIVTGPDQFPNQTFGAWSPADHDDFHVPAYFGRVVLV